VAEKNNREKKPKGNLPTREEKRVKAPHKEERKRGIPSGRRKENNLTGFAEYYKHD